MFGAHDVHQRMKRCDTAYWSSVVSSLVEEIDEVLAGGESETAEFKSELSDDGTMARDIISMANSSGGILLIGASNKGELIGIPKQRIQHDFDRLLKISSSILPWSTEIRIVPIRGKEIIYVSIQKAPSHLSPILTSNGECFKRVGTSIHKHKLHQNEEPVFESSLSFNLRPTKAFVAMSFRFEQEPALGDYFHAIERAVKETGLPIKLCRIDLVEGDYEISQKLMDEIDSSDIVIADFTLEPANVYFEVGYARAKKLRIIQTARKDTCLEFDVRNWKTLFYRNATELEARLVRELKKAYEEMLKDKLT